MTLQGLLFTVNAYIATTMLVITGASGKLGSNVINAILEHNLLSPKDLVLCTSSDPNSSRWNTLKERGAHVQFADFDDKPSMVKAFTGCDKLLLISTPRIHLDFHDASLGNGREKHHFAAIEAARQAGISHVYYTSLAFGSNSKAGVMVAHNRTEDYLRNLRGIGYTIIREGLYHQSWPLYFGHYQVPDDDRAEVIIPGDGQISWTPIEDMGLGTALVVADNPKNYDGKMFYLSSNTTRSIQDIANIVSEARGRNVRLKIVSKEEHVDYYVNERGMDEGFVKWWASTYHAVEHGECDIKDDTLEKLMAGRDKKIETVEDKVRRMLD